MVAEADVILYGAVESSPAGVADLCAPAYYGPRRQLAVSPNYSIMSYVHKRIELCAFANYRISQRSSGNGAVRRNFHVLADDHASKVREPLHFAVLASFVCESICP